MTRFFFLNGLSADRVVLGSFGYSKSQMPNVQRPEKIRILKSVRRIALWALRFVWNFVFGVWNFQKELRSC
jgi:hypothetical protein